jgi:hypothetical protein
MSGALESQLLRQCGRVPRASAVSPSGVSAASSASPGGTNVMVNSATQDPSGHTTHSETSTAVDGSVVCTAFNDSGENNGISGFAFSLDGGQTFTDGGPFPDGPSDSNLGDPSLAFSARDGIFYYAALSLQGISLWRSTNHCQSFQYVAPIHVNPSIDDKDFIAIDNTPTSPHFGRIYVGWTNFSLSLDVDQTQFSDDGGATWSTPATLFGSGPNGTGVWPAVAPNGDVYFGVLNFALDIGGLQDQFIFKSTDGGASWNKMTNIASGQLRPENAAASSACGREALTADIRFLPSPQIVITPDSSAVAGYVIHSVYPFDSDGVGPDDSNVFYRRSTDGAVTWSAEVKLNDDATTTDQFYPTIGVSEAGVLVASWYDRRLDPKNNTRFDRFMTFSLDRGLSFSANARVSNVTSPVAQLLPNFDTFLVDCYHGDYDQMAVSGSVAHVVWSDDRRLLSTGPNPDVYENNVTIGFAVAVLPVTFEGGNRASGTVYLNAPAPAGGSTVALASSVPALVTVPSSVVVRAGTLTEAFTVSSVSTRTRTPVTITATFPDGTKATANIVVAVSPTPLSLTLNPASVPGGRTSTATVALTGPAPAGGSVVALSAAPSALATVPSSVTVAAGATSATFVVSTFPPQILSATTAVVSASLNGLSKAAFLQVTPPPGAAAFDPALMAPRCTSPAAFCDTGPTFVEGRDNVSGGPEQHAPNTLGDSCPDGTSGTFHVDESIDRVRIATVDGTQLAPGKQVHVDVSAWQFAMSEFVDVFFAADASNPLWTFEGSARATTSQQLGVLRVTFTLPPAASDAGASTLPAIRAQQRFAGVEADAGAPLNCTGGLFDDRDDLVFVYPGR